MNNIQYSNIISRCIQNVSFPEALSQNSDKRPSDRLSYAAAQTQ